MADSPLFSRLFGKSPVAPMQKHMQLAAQSAVELKAFFDFVIDNDRDAARIVAERIAKLEDDADDVKREIRKNLPRSLFLPVARTDLLELLHMQDKIPNRAKDAVGLALGREMEIPGPMADAFRAYVSAVADAAGYALEAMNQLDELFETGFSGREVDAITRVIEQLDEAEHASDLRQVEVRQILFGMEDDFNPVDVIFLYRVIDWVGDIADYAQTVGNRLLYIIAK